MRSKLSGLVFGQGRACERDKNSKLMTNKHTDRKPGRSQRVMTGRIRGRKKGRVKNKFAEIR